MVGGLLAQYQKSLMAQLSNASQGHAIFRHVLDIVGSNPCRMRFVMYDCV